MFKLDVRADAALLKCLRLLSRFRSASSRRALYTAPAAALGERDSRRRIPIREFSVVSFVEEVACAP